MCTQVRAHSTRHRIGEVLRPLGFWTPPTPQRIVDLHPATGEVVLLVVLATTAGLLLLVTAPLVRGPVMPRGAALWIALGASVLSGLHLVALLFAVEHGSVATGTVLVSQYPAFTVLMAAVVWRQRPSRRQVVGLVVALASVGMIALSAS